MASSFSPYSWNISSVEELMSLAEAQERRAAARYDQLAARMDRFGSPETATLFRQLAAMEREHVEALSGWAGPTAPQGRLPDGLGEGTAADSDEVPASLTPYRALAIAVRNEERAFSLLTYVAAHAEKTDVRVRAEALALEELQHVALLRAQRRKAFHAKRHDGSNRERDIVAALQSIADLRAVAGKLLSRRAGDPSGHCAWGAWQSVGGGGVRRFQWRIGWRILPKVALGTSLRIQTQSDPSRTTSPPTLCHAPQAGRLE